MAELSWSKTGPIADFTCPVSRQQLLQIKERRSYDVGMLSWDSFPARKRALYAFEYMIIRCFGRRGENVPIVFNAGRTQSSTRNLLPIRAYYALRTYLGYKEGTC